MLVVFQKLGIPSKIQWVLMQIFLVPGSLSTKCKGQNGGVGLYIKMGLGLVPRPDLNASTDHYETVLVEIENTKDKNILICCAYRHPSYDCEIFKE